MRSRLWRRGYLTGWSTRRREDRLHYPSARASRTACWLTPNCRAITDGFTPALKADRMALTRAFGNGGAVSATGFDCLLTPDEVRGRPGLGSESGVAALAVNRRCRSRLTADASVVSSESDSHERAPGRSMGSNGGRSREERPGLPARPWAGSGLTRSAGVGPTERTMPHMPIEPTVSPRVKGAALYCK